MAIITLGELLHRKAGGAISAQNPLQVRQFDGSGNAISPATETTLGAVKTAVESLAQEDFATQATLAELKTEIDKLTALISDGALKTALTGSKALISSAPVTGAKTVTRIAAEIFAGSSRKSGRSLLMIRNLDPAVRIRVGASGVTAQTGFGIEPEAVLILGIDPATDVPVYAISEAGNVQVEVFEA